MKKTFLIAAVLVISFSVKGQFPSFPYNGNSSTGFGQNSAISSKIGFLWYTSFSDTTAANNYAVSGATAGFLKNISGFVIRCVDDLWQRSNDLQKWNKINGGGGGGSGWLLTGNSGTSPDTNFIGTTDAQDLVFKTNGSEIARFSGDGNKRVQFGYNTIADGLYSTAMGDSTFASGDYSTAMGFFTNAAGNYSTSFGQNTTANGNGATAIGANTTANGNNSTAIGDSTISNGANSTSTGSHTISNSFSGSVIGTYNDSASATSSSAFNTANRAFQIGIGTADNARANAMTVLFSGKTTLNKYGLGTFIGTPTTYPAFNSSGDIIESTSPYASTLQQVITAGNTLIGNNTIHVPGNGSSDPYDSLNIISDNQHSALTISFPFHDNAITLNKDSAIAAHFNGQLHLEVQDDAGATTYSFGARDEYANFTGIRGGFTDIGVELYPYGDLLHFSGGSATMQGDIYLNPKLGNLIIDTLNYSANSDDSMMVWRKSTGNVGMRAIPTGGGTPSLTQYRLAIGDASNLLSTNAAITGNRALISDANGVPTHSTVTNTELGYVSGVTSAIQTQMNLKAPLTSATLITPNIGVASGTSVTLSSLTANRIPVIGTSGLLTDASAYTWTPATSQVNLTTTATAGGFNLTGNDPRYNITSTTTASTPGFVMTNSTGAVGSLFIGGTTSGFPSIVGFYTSAANGFTILNSSAAKMFSILQSGNTAIAGTHTPTAKLHIAASTTAANTGQIKLAEGSDLTTPEDGNINYVSNNLKFTEGSTVYTLAKTLTNTATLNFGNTAAGTAADLTITVTGAVVGQPVVVGADNASMSADNITFWGWVSATNTVTVRLNNNNLVAAVDPASGTFRVSVLAY